MSPTTEQIFGVILAGGKSRRFGRPKVFAALGGAPMASWGVRALQAAGLPVGVISDEDGVEAALGVPVRPDLEARARPDRRAVDGAPMGLGKGRRWRVAPRM
jgi:molybdopterin-guanine dinucleotide biosynthesis protein A